ncbi:hypothetical protein WISP_00848 [Willisornis vidua]|uniref:Uncharacterized protein n=1 Tax=Willisornis vidua TaxID=1566151 RepID=A0ABQ9DUZ2_9PASS|nr:hypothetical protein WISP_00848 [Willisornis vidua]
MGTPGPGGNPGSRCPFSRGFSHWELCHPHRSCPALSLCPQAVWQWKLSQAVRQALTGKRDFPLWGSTGEGSEPPARRFFSYVFRLEGKFRGAAYEGEWHCGKPHGK